MIIVIDTNIVFSGILNTNGKIADLLMNSGNTFHFYTCYFLRGEMKKHRCKLAKISRMGEDQVLDSEYLITRHIQFCNEAQIPVEILRATERLVSDIDPADAVFVALAQYLNGTLWTGDRRLRDGLRLKGFKDVCTTSELYELRKELEGAKENKR